MEHGRAIRLDILAQRDPAGEPLDQRGPAPT